MDITSSPELALAVYRESNDAFLVVRFADHRIVDANPTTLRLTGYSKSDLLDKRWTDLLSADDPKQFDDLPTTLAQTGKVPSSRGWALLARNGDRLPIMLSACRVASPAGEQGLFILRDVSECRRAEHALVEANEQLERRLQVGLEACHQLNEKVRESEQWFRLAFDEAPVGFCILDDQRRFVQVNAKFSEILGYAAEEWIGRPIDDLIHQDDREVQHVQHGPGRSPAVVTDERRYVRKDGTFCWVSQTDSWLRKQGDQRRWCLRMIEDVSGRKQADEEFARLSAKVQYTQKLESLGALAGGVAHDFNNLLTAIIGNAELALDRLAAHSPARQEIEQIQTVAKRAAELCKQMLAYSGKGRFVLRSVYLSHLLREMEPLLRLSVSDHVVVKYNLSLDIPLLQCDANQIQQLFLNLVTNASEALGEKSGVITISTGSETLDRGNLLDTYLDEELPEGVYVYAEVCDTGCGMDEETVGKLFDPFFTTKFPGRGLGLAAVLGIVRGHKGAIKVYSQPGRGTTIKVLFPAANSDDRVPRNAPAAAASSSKNDGSLLVVDDEPTVRSLVQRVMEKRGFHVLSAADGPHAVRLFRDHADDIVLVLLDMTMPHLSGEEIFRELRRIRPDVRVVLSSGYTKEDATSRFTPEGLAGFLQKPYSPSALWQTVEHALRPRNDASFQGRIE